MRSLFFIILLSMLTSNLSAEIIDISKSSSLQLKVPSGFTAKKIAGPLPSMDVGNGDIKLKFTAIPIPDEKLTKLGGVEGLLKLTVQKFQTGSVEQKCNLQKLKIGNAVYATFTDASLVGKKSSPGNWRMITSGIIQGKDGLLNFTLFSHSSDSKQFKQMIEMLNSASVKMVK
jgi:hypothetical protein